MTERVFVMGAGRAGRGLARAFRASGVDVVGVHGRHAASEPDDVTAGAIPPEIARATTVLVTVRDAQLDDALAELSLARLGTGSVVLHASGSADPAGLLALRERGHPAGTFHPLVPFIDPKLAPERLRRAWIGIDGDDAAIAASERLAASLGARTVRIPPGEKARYHAAAVVVANFPAVLLAIGERLLAGAGVPPEDARDALLPLLVAAVENLRGRPASEALTGPIVRGDAETIRAHLAAIAGDDRALEVYRLLSLNAIDLARLAGTNEAELERITELLR
ncbi:MAG: DUF2520 domain-containing protein [Gemmatimonadota bacterium]|nr:DUF2520 domain-containing protein [Gemmatimonadota bacterium]